MIFNAKDRPLNCNPGTLPNLSGALLNWFQRMTFTKVTKTVVDFQVVEQEDEYTALGVRLPMQPQQVVIKPEGQRSWRWEVVFATPDLILNPDEIIRFGSVKYRVMGKLDWKEYGYLEYHISQDFER